MLIKFKLIKLIIVTNIIVISPSTGGIYRHLILQDSTRTSNTYSDKTYNIYIDNTNEIIIMI